MIKKLFLILFIFTFLTFFSSEIKAQVFELSPIEVYDSIINILEAEPSSYSVIFPSKFEGEFKDLGELLSKIPGIHVTKLGGRGAYTVVSIRGSTSAQVVVYLNGILLNASGEGAIDISTIPLNAIERIEIYRGSVPARFGIPGIGGVINIVTLEKADFKTFKTTIGSFRSFALENITSIKNGLFSINLETSKGNYPYHNDNGTPYNLEDDYETRRQNNAHRISDIKISKEISQNGKLFLNYFSKHKGLPKPAPGSDKEGNISHSNLSDERFIAEISKEISFSNNLKGDISLYGVYSEREFLNPYEDVGWYGQKHNWYNSYKVGTQVSLNYLINQNNFLEVYLDLFKEGLNPGGDIVKQGEFSPLKGIKTYERNILSISLDYTVLRERFSIIPWFRFLKSDDRSEKLNGETLSSSSEHLSYGLRVKYALNENWSIKFTWGILSRIPNFYEKFGDGAFIIPNPYLENEEGKNFDLSLEYRGRNVAGYITYFQSDMDNLVEFIMLNPRFGRYINISGARIKGVESSLSYILKNGWSLSLSYTYMETESEVPGYKKGKPLPNRPEHNLNLRVERSWKNYEAFIEGELTSENYFDTGGLVKFNDWWTVNLGLSYRFSEKEKLTLTINNITDNQRFRTKPAFGFGPEKIADYPPVGRNFYLTYIKNF
ncbi:MAG: TonB-dependent receptor [Synergistetes bacterium]|nr:TonB-dependent receptor [Synergistota bacterium]MCX8128107.1 TonB-dependent receptor [Synergistota bacterium]MDW8192483.1 TonB-dependent receptor [Synergistota bacterium]